MHYSTSYFVIYNLYYSILIFFYCLPSLRTEKKVNHVLIFIVQILYLRYFICIFFTIFLHYWLKKRTTDFLNITWSGCDCGGWSPPKPKSMLTSRLSSGLCRLRSQEKLVIFGLNVFAKVYICASCCRGWDPSSMTNKPRSIALCLGRRFLFKVILSLKMIQHFFKILIKLWMYCP